MDINKMLTLSTIHISTSTAELIDKDPYRNRFPALSIYPKGEFGWFIYFDSAELNEEERKYIPEDLLACIDLAHTNDCSILCLDCDGLTCDLPKHDWDEDTLPACDLS